MKLPLASSIIRLWIGAALLACGLSRNALAAPPASAAASQSAPARQLHIAQQTPPPGPYVTDAEIGKAIDKGAAFLAAQFKNSLIVEADYAGKADDGRGPMYRRPGADALCVYALLQAGLANGDPQYSKDSKFMAGLIESMKTLQIPPPVYPIGYFGTYTRGLRATALALIDRPEDRKALSDDIFALLDSCKGGAYTYDMYPSDIGSHLHRTYAGPPMVNWDNSNSQYGLLGVWSGAEVGAEIPNDYWLAVEKHWNGCQLPDGTWSYEGKGPARYSMTCAGIASLFVCHDYIDIAKFGTQVGREPFTPELEKGLNWLETGDNCLLTDLHPYWAYGLERVGLASGFKYFGNHDWYREFTTKIVQRQGADGSWRGVYSAEIDTAYYLLFLARGRHPILMNKLRFEHYWANRPRDVARLADFAGKELETVFNWQVVNLQHDWHDWTDSPILYIASHETPKLTDADYAKIRAFVEAGGLLFTQADGNSSVFDEYAQKTLLHKVFPEYEMHRVPANHPIYSLTGELPTKPPLFCVDNGARLLWVHSPTDISQWWQQRATKSHKDAFRIGLNLFIYAAGKRDFQNRLSTTYIPPPPPAAAGNSVTVARVRYPMTSWDPEPYAWQRFANWMGWETTVGVQTQPVDIDKLADVAPSQMPLAHLTGTFPFAPNPAQAKSLATYVQNGGVLFLDACGGEGFNDSIKQILAAAFPGVKLERLGATDPLLSASGDGMSDLSKPLLRAYTKSLNLSSDGFLAAHFGRGYVIYSPMDITAGMLGTQTWGINGYQASYSLQFMKNLVLWSARGAPEKSAATRGAQ